MNAARDQRGLRAARVVLVASGLLDVVPLLAVAAGLTVILRNRTVTHLGPIQFVPALRVIILVPLLLAVACSLAHATARTPVIVRNRRTVAARALSYAVVLGFGALLLWLGDSLSVSHTFAAEARNLLLLTGLATAVGALAGTQYAWAPCFLVLGYALTSPQSDSPWSANAWLLGDTATSTQLAVAGTIAVAGLALAITDPRSPGYLRARAR